MNPVIVDQIKYKHYKGFNKLKLIVQREPL